MKYFICILIAVSMQACTGTDAHLTKVLSASGDNRLEFQKVLSYYSSPRDSLKYKAAVYLIKNMPYHSFLFDPKSDLYDTIYFGMNQSDKSLELTGDSLTDRTIRKKIFDDLWKVHFQEIGEIDPSRMKEVKDIDYVTADFLIDNIEYAFKAWDNPWSKSYSFDDFCKYILPYRVGSEPLDNWRPYIFKELAWVKDTLKGTTDPIQVCGYINKWLQNTIYDDNLILSSPSGIKLSNLFKGRVWSTCYDQTALGIAVLRTLGVASAASTIPHWGVRSGMHEFNAVLDNRGKWQHFSTGYLNPDEFYLDNRAPKVYLSKFFIDPKTINTELYEQGTQEDITDNLFPVTDIELENPRNSDMYLCTFDKTNWTPLCMGKRRNGKVLFSKMGREIVYLPSYNINGEFVPAGPPISVDKDGAIKEIKRSGKNVEYSFNRKYPVLYPRIYDPRCMDMIGGRFQIADNINFINAKNLHIIKKKPEMQVQFVHVSPSQGRFVRFLFPLVDYHFKSGPASISFYDRELNKVQGRYIGSAGLTKGNLNNIFDDDLLSHVKTVEYHDAINFERPDIIVSRASHDSLWVGIELTKDITISALSYCPRNDKNGIYSGMRYELFYWHDKNWKSLGIKTATTTHVRFTNIPTGALLWLRNLDEGEDERIFLIENDDIKWM